METYRKLADRHSSHEADRHKSRSRGNNRVLIIAAVIGALGAVAAAVITAVLPHLMPPGGRVSSSGTKSSAGASSSPSRPDLRRGTSPSGQTAPDSAAGRSGSHGTTSGSTPGPAPSAQSSAPPSATYSETVGGPAHTWTDYSDAGGTEGKTIPAFQTVQVTCRVQGFAVADGDTWWYRIASSPWDDTFYASADAFYNNGQTLGTLLGTPPVDPKVPVC
jgi:hypothetical protein